MPNYLETYLQELRDIRSSGAAVKETSYYPALSNLLNEIGKQLKPRVRCIINIKNQGAGFPDGGLFTSDQLQKASEAEPLLGQIPARGVIEVKGTIDDAWLTADGVQVSKYWGKYRQVLVTNYRDFVLVGQDTNGRPAKLETYRLAESESSFWAAAAMPYKLAQAHGERFTEYLKRVLLHAAPLTAPEDVAWFLASYARDAKARVEGANLPALNAIRTALEESLGLKFKGKKGDHFFRSTLVQTLFYGVFSAWVLWSKQHPLTDYISRFDWKTAAWLMRVPMIKALFEQIATPSKLGPLGLVEVLDWTTAALNRVDRAAFFSKFEEGHAVQYFYEPFLRAFDPELREDLGVWYTPPEIVQYMVARIDTVLRKELDLPDGLADPRVYVLDPCCGTGAYLVEVLKRIAATLKEKGKDALGSDDVKHAAIERVFGFEILPAPFVIAHLQLGLLLQNLGAPLSDSKNERVGVYLTNALTGWEPPSEEVKVKLQQLEFSFAELKQERDAAEKVKREIPILVILGNPPYNAFAGVSPAEEQGLVEPYKEGLITEWGIKKFNLDELYVRFFRLAERRIAEMTGKGIVCYISNHSWVNDPSFVVLRKRLLASFDRFWVENMHGNRKISEYAPDGRTSETIFAIPGFSVGIQQGVVISLWVKSSKQCKGPQILFRNDLYAARAIKRRAQLLESLKVEDFDAQYEPAYPDRSNRFSFRPLNIAVCYQAWPKLIDIALRQPFAGLSEDRHKALIGIDRSNIQARMKMYFNPNVNWETLAALGTCLTTNVPRFNAKAARRTLLQTEMYDETRLLKYAMRPFDLQWCYYSPVRPLWREPRPEYWAAYEVGSPVLVTRFKAAKLPEGPPIAFARQLCDYHMMPPNAFIFPFFLLPTQAKKTLLTASKATPTANLSPSARAYLATLSVTNPDADAEAAGLIWLHALAIGYSPAYLTENTDAIHQDWPRVPLPNNKGLLLASAELGRQIAALLDTESPVKGVTSDTIRPELRLLAIISCVGGGTLNPDAGDLAVAAGWGHAGKNGVTMPGKGKIVEREYTSEERAAIDEGATALGLNTNDALAHLGNTTCDIYLNDIAFWRNIPSKVWKYTIGGYQVIKKWLSYREQRILGRSLTKDEVREVMNIARRIAAILLLELQLDTNYHIIKENRLFNTFGQNAG